MKPLRSNHPSSDIIYQGTVITTYDKGISEKFSGIRNCFNVSPFSKLNIHCVTLRKTGPVEMPSKQSSVCTTSHVTVADSILAKQADF
jgi:hypothetical protein